jgi:Uncharacterised nucleotidyltransferase
VAQTSYGGPLENLGPAARWCLTAGIRPENIQPPSACEFSLEVECILKEGIAGVALRGLESDPAWRDEPASHWIYNTAMNGQLRTLRVDFAGAKLLRALSELDIPLAVVKGPTMAALHPTGWPRSYSDIDIVIPPRHFGDAIKAASDLEYEHSDRSIPQWQWFDSYCREGVNMHGPAGGNIDIHHHFPPWGLTTRFTTESVINRSIPGDLSGVSTQFAHRHDQLIIASLHILNDLWKGKVGLNSWRDVIVLLNLIDDSAATEAFKQNGLGWLLRVITETLERSVPESNVRAIGATERRSPVTKWRLRTMGWHSNSTLSRHRLSWALRLPPKNGLAYAVGVAFPSKNYIRSRHGSLIDYWKEGWSETLHTAHGADFRMTTVEDKALSAE